MPNLIQQLNFFIFTNLFDILLFFPICTCWIIFSYTLYDQINCYIYPGLVLPNISPIPRTINVHILYNNDNMIIYLNVLNKFLIKKEKNGKKRTILLRIIFFCQWLVWLQMAIKWTALKKSKPIIDNVIFV